MTAEKKKIGIYGGAFSPIHSGHVRAAELFCREMELDKLLVIPTAIPPHKPQITEASVEERIEMARLALAELPAYKDGRIEVSDYEATSGEKNYTVLTLEHFSAEDRTLFLLVGTDMFLSLGKWYRSADIFALAEIVLMRRESDTENFQLIQEKKAEYTEKFGARVHEIDEPPIVISSTEIRGCIKANEDTDDYIPEAVAKYIREKGLYK